MLGYGSPLYKSAVGHGWHIHKSTIGHGWCVGLAITITFTQQLSPPLLTWWESYVFFVLGFCVLVFWGQPFFVWHPICVLHRFEMPLAPIILVFTLSMAFQGMLSVFTFMPTSFPRLAKLLYFCRCPILLCCTLVLSLLLLEVSFRLRLVSFWGCLKLISRAFICFIGSFKPSKMKSNKFFVYPLTELLKI